MFYTTQNITTSIYTYPDVYTVIYFYVHIVIVTENITVYLFVYFDESVFLS